MIPTEILNYKIIRQLGSGGMGQVFLAKNKDIDQMVAVKSLHPHLASNQALRERFKQEAVMLSSLDHPNIVKFLNYVETDEGVFLIMEYVDGMTLEDFINKKNGLIVEKRAYPMMKEILSAFTYAHSRGIVHRDIKPSNIFLNQEGHVKVMDFGIAQIVSESSNSESNVVMGTPEYMSPEQVYGKAIDQRSDIYSLGVLFHQMLTGTAPYNATTISELEIKRRVLSEALPRMKSYYPYISDGLQRIVDKATSKDKEKRYADCVEIQKDLKKILDPDPINKTVLFGGIGIAVVLIAIGAVIWDYCRTKVYYYKDIVEYYGIPEGIGELSGREQSHRDLSYRFEHKNWKLRRVTIVNSKDNPVSVSETEHKNTRFPDVYYYYSDNGKIDYKKVYDEYGKLIYKMDYDENLRTATFKYDDEFGTAMTLGANTTDTHNDLVTNNDRRSRISRYLLYWEEGTGLLKKVLYAAGDDNTLACDQDGIYGREYDYDEKGHIVKISFLGPDAKVKGNAFGLAVKKLAYDENDNWISIEYFSADGRSSHDGMNCPKVTLTYDEWGNRIKEVYTSSNGMPALHKEFGCSGFIYEYEDGNRTSFTSINGNEKPMVNQQGWSKAKFTYDEGGHQTSISYYDLNDAPTLNKTPNGSWAKEQYVVDAKGLLLECSYFDAEGKASNVNGFHKMKCEYDDVGNVLKNSYYDSKGNLTTTWGRYALVTYVYDEYYRLVKTRYFDTKSNPVICNDNTAGEDMEYDKKGNLVKLTCIGKDGKPTLCANLFATQSVVYDENGNISSLEYRDVSNNLCETGEGYARIEYVYEPKSLNVSEEKFFDAKNNMLYFTKYVYSVSGNVTRESKHNPNGTLYSGTAVMHYEYDENNRNTLCYTTDMNGNRVNQPGTSYCQIKNKYDENGNIIEQTFSAPNGMAAVDERGAFKRIHQFNEIGQIIYEKNIGLDGNPTKVDPEGKQTYDNCGNVLELTCYDGFGNKAIGSDGWFKQANTYDEFNQLVTKTFSDLNGNLAMSKSYDFAKYVAKFDETGRKVGESYYDASNKIIATGKYNYESNGRLIDVTYYDAKGVEISNAPSGNGATDWRAQWKDAKRQLPITLADGFVITDVEMTTDGLDVNMKLTQIAKSDIGENMSQLEEMLKPIYNSLRDNTGIPSNVNFDMYIFDKNGVFLLIF